MMFPALRPAMAMTARKVFEPLLSTPIRRRTALSIRLILAVCLSAAASRGEAVELALGGLGGGPFQEHRYSGYSLAFRVGTRVPDRASWLFLGASLDSIAGRGRRAIMVTAGPGVALRLVQGRRSALVRYELHGALLSRNRFGERDLGGHFQFFHRLSLLWPLGRRYHLAAGLWHLSNGGLYERNPGLSGFTLEIGARY